MSNASDWVVLFFIEFHWIIIRTLAMDVWNDTQAEDNEASQEWTEVRQGKDALLILLDIRESMFTPCTSPQSKKLSDDQKDPITWFHACIKVIIKIMKSKIIARDNSLIGIIFFGSNKATGNTALGQIYEYQTLSYPSAQRIKALKTVYATPSDNIQSEFNSMQMHEELAVSNILWQAGTVFSEAKLNGIDTQRIWIFTNDDAPVLPDGMERSRFQIQAQNHIELNRSLSLFYIHPPDTPTFSLTIFYDIVFQDVMRDTSEKKSNIIQSAFGITSLNDLMETLLRKRFRKRRLAILPLRLTATISIGVELYALAIVQHKSTPIFLNASTNKPLSSETKWLCEDTGAYLSPENIKKYHPYGGTRIYFSKDDIIELKYVDTPSLHLICFHSIESLCQRENIRSPYFIFPNDNFVEKSSKAFVSLLCAMEKKRKYALARMIARKYSEPRYVALLPQREEYDELGQIRPTGFHVVFLPYCDDIRDVCVENYESPAVDEKALELAMAMMKKLELAEVPRFENPELQKHYASIQALALDEEELEYDESHDSTLPDEAGFRQGDVQDAIERYRNAFGDMSEIVEMKRKAQSKSKNVKRPKAIAEAQLSPAKVFDTRKWREMDENSLQKTTVKEMQMFLRFHNQSTSGRKADLMHRIEMFLNSEADEEN
uniref:ATPdependent DNA helicase 2 subunit putative n=1 Tax=Albugo laibachii Nc14 TaxID=890382 RepID=F0WGR4_9STRA|nr:ATPdependent DNA helicase 2 subunit putative [Albugo laibachii Nc14]|eukprot:CCA20428.1 ATPdependent DNA helicase 2 subunit putative [Albugo laibachii Nc14]